MVVRRGRHFWLKVLVGLVFAILVLDVLALTYAVVPLAALQQKRAGPTAISARLTQSPVDQALILPTHDPRKPWVTRTPRPTATPWLILVATLAPQHLATPGPTENATQVAPGATRAGATAESSRVVTPGAPSPVATVIQPVGAPSPTLSPQSVEPTGLASSAQAEFTETPTPAGMLPAETLVAPTSDQLPPPIAPDDAAQFGAYVWDNYNTIAGQPLDMVAVKVDTTEADRPKVVVEVLGNDANNVFATQTAAVMLDYGRRLLDDTKFYSGGQSCEIAVASMYKTSNGDTCTSNPAWCSVDTFDASANAWTVTWTYVRGTSVDGMDSVDTWNTGQ